MIVVCMVIGSCRPEVCSRNLLAYAVMSEEECYVHLTPRASRLHGPGGARLRLCRRLIGYVDGFAVKETDHVSRLIDDQLRTNQQSGFRINVGLGGAGVHSQPSRPSLSISSVL